MRTHVSWACGIAFLLAAGLAACDGGVGLGRNARLTVALTDAPSDYFASATVDIGEIEIVPAGDGPPIMLTDDGGTHDLLDLEGDVTADLATLDIDPGSYVQLRLKVEGAGVELANDLEFADGSTARNLFVPSGAQTGVKVNLRSADGEDAAGLEITPGETILVVDIDVSQNFVIQGDPDTPAGIKGVLFTPLLRTVVQNVAGSISGTVTSDVDDDGLEGETVRAVLQNSDEPEELQTDEVTAVTEDDGSYTIDYLSPGTYEVGVVDFSAESRTVTVEEDEDVTGINFSGSSTSGS